MLKVSFKSKKSKARLASLKTGHGVIKTPFFMPIATKGAVKTLTTSEVKKIGAQILLSNTYHLMLRPGVKMVKKAGGLHKFMDWSGPILTDSGGYQVFSLSQLRKMSEKGVYFSDPESGAKHELTPESSIKIQQNLGVDIIMVLDECTPYPCDYHYARKSMQMTTRWAARCKKLHNKKQLMFGIVQGSVYKDLRQRSVADLVALDFDGYAIGGLAVGEGTEKMIEVLDYTVPALPENKPRYLMGLGKPEEIVAAVKRGVDMFDCVIPTREGRHGKLFAWHKRLRDKPGVTLKGSFYETINIMNSKFVNDLKPINKNSRVPELQNLSRAYLHHLFKVKEPLGQKLASLNNLEFYLDLMDEIRASIKAGKM